MASSISSQHLHPIGPDPPNLQAFRNNAVAAYLCQCYRLGWVSEIKLLCSVTERPLQKTIRLSLTTVKTAEARLSYVFHVLQSLESLLDHAAVLLLAASHLTHLTMSFLLLLVTDLLTTGDRLAEFFQTLEFRLFTTLSDQPRSFLALFSLLRICAVNRKRKVLPEP